MVRKEDFTAFLDYTKGFLQKPEKIPFSYVSCGQYKTGLNGCININSTWARESAKRFVVNAEGFDEASGLNVKLEYTEYRDYPVCEWVVWFENRGQKTSGVIEEVNVLDGKIKADSPSLWHCNGEFYTKDSYTPEYNVLTDEVLSFSPEGGRSCEKAFPYYRMQSKTNGMVMAIGWPGQWESSFSYDGEDVHIKARQQKLKTVLLPGEKIRSPRITMMFYDGEEHRGINMWRRWYRTHLIPGDYDKLPCPRIARNYNGGGVEFTKATAENQKAALTQLQSSPAKPDVWWLDAGWYPCKTDNGNSEWRKTGTWEADPERFPDGLNELGNYAEENGAELLLWFEPERLRRGTELFCEHNDWVLESPNAAKKGTDEEDFLLDIGEPVCLEWLKERIGTTIKESNVKIYRQDFNIQPLEYWRTAEADDREGYIENRYIQGLLSLWDYLLCVNPGLHIDAVAAGGRRLDMEIIRRALPLHPTDYGYGEHPVKLSFHQIMSEWFPYYRSSVLCWEEPDGTYRRGGGKPHLSSFIMHCSLAPMVHFESLDYGKDNDKLESLLSLFYGTAELMIEGDYYELTEHSNKNNRWFARQFDSPEKGKGFIQVISLLGCIEPIKRLYPYIFNKGRYRFSNLETKESFEVESKELQNEGLLFELPSRAGAVWMYECIEMLN